jgi:hypothetical protein
MKRKLAILFALIGWFAVITQFVLMIENRATSITEAILRFFSFFTILTNILVAIYFTCIASLKNQESKLISKSGILTAITTYITMVGLVYQIALRHVWQPKGLQLIVDELLHSVIPVLVIIFWYLYETAKPAKYLQILKWAIYPLAYLLYILVRGSFSNFYPYPFVDVTNLGMAKALTNAGVLLLIFIIISAIFLFIRKSVIKR